MRRNNKALYEKIMRNVSKEVKRSLNEDTEIMDNDEIYDKLLSIFDGLQNMVSNANVGCNSSDFSWGAEDMAQEIWEQSDFVCNCPPEILGQVIQDIIANT